MPPVNETTKHSNPEGDTCLKKVERLPDARRPWETAAGTIRPPVPPTSDVPAAFSYTPDFICEAHSRNEIGRRAAWPHATTHGPRGLKYRLAQCLPYVGDVIGALAIFIILFVGLFIGEILQ